MPGNQLTWYDATYDSALGHPIVHRHAETVRYSIGSPRSPRCLRRVWAASPYLPTLSAINLVVVASTQVSQQAVSRPSGTSACPKGPMS
jgi:hypothetical protein